MQEAYKLAAKNNTPQHPRVMMIAAECRDLIKVGGLADVTRDLSRALRRLGTPVELVVPHYAATETSATLEADHSYTVSFGGRSFNVEVSRCVLDGVTVYLLHNPEFFGGEYGEAYIDSEELGHGPFEEDAKRFAFFSAAAVEFVSRHQATQPVDVIHGHDWHTGVLFFLLKNDPRYSQLDRRVGTLFTIHNLDYQGTRPFELKGGRSLLAFADWFPDLYARLKGTTALDLVRDPGAARPCFNAMRAGINLADLANTVSPTYAEEITRSDDAKRNFIGGRGLEADLRRLRDADRLHGILNGLEYRDYDPKQLDPPFDVDLEGWPQARRQHKVRFLRALPELVAELEQKLGPKRFKNSAQVRLKLKKYKPEAWLEKPLVVAVTRAARQKIKILFERLDSDKTVVERLLKRDLRLVVLGTGELHDELETINRSPRGLYIRAFDTPFARQLYLAGDLFLMPSDFEPCGISQMIAMRYGCLPLVHDIGGLHDTVRHQQTGFLYKGADRQATKEALLRTLDEALARYRRDPKRWAELQARAMQQRFDWQRSAERYLGLYGQVIRR